jgi:DNA-binding MarR family transcriptional regulator
MTPQDICIRTAMDKVAVSRAARDLAEAGHADAAPHPRDGRSHLLDLTPRGRDLYARIAPLALALEAELLEGWTETAIARLKADLVRLEDTARALGGR